MHARTRRQRLAAGLLLALGVPAAASASTTLAAEAPVAVKDGPTTTIPIPADAAYYTTLGSFTSVAPILGPDGALTWFYSRQRTVDDGRALGTIAISLGAQTGSIPIAPTFGSVPGTTALRGSSNGYGRTDWGGLTTLATDAVAWRGANWVLDRHVAPRPSRVALVAIRDGQGGRVVARYPAEFTPINVIPTDRGLRTFGYLARKVGSRLFNDPAVTPPGSTKAVRLKVANGIGGVAAAPGGALLVTGASTRPTLPDPVLVVDRRGNTRRMPDRRSPSAPFTTGSTGIAPIAGGFVLAEQTVPNNSYAAVVLDKSSVVVRDLRGRVKLRRAIADLDYPGAAACKLDKVVHTVLRVTPGPDGAPLVTTVCGRPEPAPWGGVEFRIIQATTVALNPDLTVRWWRPASEVWIGSSPPQLCGSQTTDALGRLAIVRCYGAGYGTPSAITTVSAPDLDAPATGRLRSTKRVGKQALRARITCGSAFGTVCSGIVRVTANGQPLGSAEYALPGRPGALQGELDRQIELSAPLPKRYSVTLAPRS